MINFNENKDFSTIDSQIIKLDKKENENSSLIELFNNNYKIPKSLKGDKDIIDYNNFENKINTSIKIKKNLLVSQKLRKKTGIHLNKNNVLFNHNNNNIIIFNTKINLNNSIDSFNTSGNNFSFRDKTDKKLLLQKRFDQGNIALNTIIFK